MENYFIYNDPIRIVWRKGDSSEPYVDKVESQKVINNMVVLTEIPDEFTHVSISGYTEIYEGTPSTYQFIVNYENGIITFHASQEGLTISNMTYKGRGFILYPASRIYGHNDNPDVTITLQQIIDLGVEALDALAQLIVAIANAEAATALAITQADYAKAQGDYAKAEGDYAKFSGDSLVFKGTYAAGTEYVARNMVYYNGATYMAIATTTGNVPTNVTYWKKIGSMVWKGTYASATAYTYGDFVTDASNYNLYMSISESNTGQLLTNTSYWNKMITVQGVVDAAVLATTNANTATGLANTATANANTARDAANVATGLANTATNNANEATTNANIATDAANDAADAANIATTNANNATINANDAADAANTAKTNANEATELANEATNSANIATDAANDAADAANTAKTNADIATSLANIARDEANDAATNANAQAEFAQTQGNYAKDSGDAFVHKGDYSAAIVYMPRNMVYYNGCTYMCILTTTLGTLPTNTTYWRKIVAFNWKGVYSTSITYQYGDFVIDSTSQKMYLCIKDSTLNVALSVVANWAPILDISAIVTATITATTNANTATTNANTATTNANDATASATNAATLANNAATEANTAKTNTEAATIAANTATTNANNAVDTANSLVERTVSKGVYSASTTYYPNNVVTYNGSSYMCTVQALNKVPTDTGYWQLLALKGNDGTGSVVSLTSLNDDIVVAGTVQNPDLAISSTLKTIWNDKYTKAEIDTLISQATSNVEWKVAVDTYADIDTSYPNPQDGWTVNVKDTDYTYRYTGTEWIPVSANSIPNASSIADGKMSISDFNKLAAISVQANKTSHSSVNGQILIDGAENVVYVHPTTAGNKHIPAGGSADNFLKYGSDGAAIWATPTLSKLADVAITSPSSSHVLKYNGTNWINSRLTFDDIGSGTSNGDLVTNLNADMVDGYHASDTVAANTVVARDGFGDAQIRRLRLTAEPGVAPLIVTSDVFVGNLNADMVDGYHLNQNLVTFATPTFVGVETTGSYPIVAKKTGFKSWTIHHPETDDLVFAPSLSVNDVDWDWGNSFTLRENGDFDVYSVTLRAEEGIAPLVVSSTTLVENLNAHMLEGHYASTMPSPDTVVVRNALGEVYGLIASSATSYSSGIASGVAWRRLAETDITTGQKTATFEINWSTGSVAGYATIQIGLSGISGPSITQISFGSSNTAIGIVKARLVYHATSTGYIAAFEVYKTTQAIISFNVNMIGSTGWSLLTNGAVGNLPTDYTSTELTFVHGFATDGVLSSGLVSSTVAPLKVASNVMVANLNAQYLSGFQVSSSSTAWNIPARDEYRKIAEVAATRAVVKDLQLAITSEVVVATFTAPTSPTTAIYTVKIYMRCTAARNVSITINYTDASGTHNRVVNSISNTMPIDVYDFIPITLLVNASSAINVVAKTTVANSVYISAVISEEG
jgi:chemotaxis protein histidine kinase CheA